MKKFKTVFNKFFAVMLAVVMVFGMFAVLLPATATAAEPAVGSIIEFGDYNWRVLDVRDGRALIITENVIQRRQYHHTPEHVTWATSDVRRWLNNDFFITFSATDRARIAETTVVK